MPMAAKTAAVESASRPPDALSAIQTVTVSDDRVLRLLSELRDALGRMAAADAADIGASIPVDVVQALYRRGRNLTTTLMGAASFSYGHASAVVEAWQRDQFHDHLRSALEKARTWGSSQVAAGSARIASFRDDPAGEGLRLLAMALAALASSGGLDGDGGLPDIDIPLLGIGAHRSPFTHSVLIGAGTEALVAVLIRTVIRVHSKLPETHDPFFDTFAAHGSELLDAISRGVSVGLAYHLLVDALAQPSPFHGLPVPLPLEVHQAVLAANGVAEALDAVHRPVIHAQTSELVAEHKLLLAEQFEVEPAFIEFLGPDNTSLLEKHGSWMLALSTGALSPYTEPQAQFVLVALQRTPAKTRHEVAWVWLINLMRVALLVEQSASPTSRAKAFLYEKAVDAAATLRRFAG